MIEFINNIQNSLIYKNFFLVLSGLDNTLLLLLISLPIGFILALLFALGRVSKITFLSRTIAIFSAFGHKFFEEPLKGRKYYKKAADEGYLVGMENYIFSFNKKDRLNKNECKDYLKYSQMLSEENSLLTIISEINSNLGRLNYSQSYFIYI